MLQKWCWATTGAAAPTTTAATTVRLKIWIANRDKNSRRDISPSPRETSAWEKERNFHLSRACPRTIFTLLLLHAAAAVAASNRLGHYFTFPVASDGVEAQCPMCYNDSAFSLLLLLVLLLLPGPKKLHCYYCPARDWPRAFLSQLTPRVCVLSLCACAWGMLRLEALKAKLFTFRVNKMLNYIVKL